VICTWGGCGNRRASRLQVPKAGGAQIVASAGAVTAQDSGAAFGMHKGRIPHSQHTRKLSKGVSSGCGSGEKTRPATAGGPARAASERNSRRRSRPSCGSSGAKKLAGHCRWRANGVNAAGAVQRPRAAAGERRSSNSRRSRRARGGRLGEGHQRPVQGRASDVPCLRAAGSGVVSRPDRRDRAPQLGRGRGFPRRQEHPRFAARL
jgi:hypothetical protein